MHVCLRMRDILPTKWRFEFEIILIQLMKKEIGLRENYKIIDDLK